MDCRQWRVSAMAMVRRMRSPSTALITLGCLLHAALAMTSIDAPSVAQGGTADCMPMGGDPQDCQFEGAFACTGDWPFDGAIGQGEALVIGPCTTVPIERNEDNRMCISRIRQWFSHDGLLTDGLRWLCPYRCELTACTNCSLRYMSTRHKRESSFTPTLST